jgi:hypothetical protein
MMLKDEIVLNYIDPESGGFITEVEREALISVLHEKPKSVSLNKRKKPKPDENDFIVDENDENILYNGNPMSRKDMHRKIDLINARREQFYQLTILCIISQSLLIF